MTYQGHLADGSSIQKHSAGGAYPFVLQLRDALPGYYWREMLGPGIDTVLRFNSSRDWDAAVRRLLAVRENEDAWAFELERLCMFAGQHLAPMLHASTNLGAPSKWRDMGPARRVSSLLALGRVRNTLKMPTAQSPVFAQLAALAV